MTTVTWTGARSRFVRSNGLYLHLRRHGQGPDVLVLPGITSPAATWDFAARRLGEDHTVWVLDLRGRGLSSVAEPGSYRLEDYAADAAGAIVALGLDRPAVLGHSLGARIAAALGVAHPELVGPLVLVDPPLTGPGRDAYPIALDFYAEAIRQARSGSVIEYLRALEPTWSDEQLHDRARWLATCDPVAIAETYVNFHAEDFLGRWERLPAPALVHGAESPVVTSDGAQELGASNPRATVTAVPDAAHMVPWDNLDGFLAAVRPLLGAVALPQEEGR
jgi:N-formylmaleamate deformylase